MVHRTVRFIIYSTDVSERKSGKEVFKNLAPAGFQLGTYGTAIYHQSINQSKRIYIAPYVAGESEARVGLG